MQAVLLVGGFGTRLRPLTLTTPKQMLPLVDRPMIEHVLAGFAGHGVDTVVLSLGYRADAFRAAYPQGRCGGVELLYAEEPEPLDTAGATRFAFDECLAAPSPDATADTASNTPAYADIDNLALEPPSSTADTAPLVVANGDVISDVDITAMVDLHCRSGAEATIHLTCVDDPSRYGVVETDPEGRVLAFREKPDAATAAEMGASWVNAGTYVMSRSVIDRIPAGRAVSLEREIFPALADEGALWAMRQDCYWLDAGTPLTYLQAQGDLLEGRRPPRLGANQATDADALARTEVSPTAAVIDSAVMEGAAVADQAVIAASALHSNTRVGEFAAVHNSAVLTGATVGPYAVVARSAVMTGAEVGENAVVRASAVHPGAVIGAGALIEDSVVASSARIGAGAELTAATLIGEGAEIDAGAVLSGARVPDDDSQAP